MRGWSFMAKKAKAVTRRGKAKTAYELLERVCEHIAAEPKRYYQGWWVLRSAKRIAAADVKLKAPPCNTIACRAGWVVLLHDGRNTRQINAEGYGTMRRALEILGVEHDDGLFNGD